MAGDIKKVATKVALRTAAPKQDGRQTTDPTPVKDAAISPTGWVAEGAARVTRPPALDQDSLPTSDTLGSRALSESFRALTAIQLGPNGTLSGEPFWNVLKTNDPLVANDLYRARTAMDPDNKDKTFVHSGGMVRAGAAFTKGNKMVPGKLPLSVGWSGSGGVEYGVISLQDKGLKAIGGAAKDLIVNIPRDSKEALKLESGEEFYVRQHGTGGVSAAATVAGTVLKGAPMPITVPVGVSVGGHVAGGSSLNVKKLSGTEVFVMVGGGLEGGFQAGPSLTPGVALSRRAMAGNMAPRHTDAVQAAIADNNRTTRDARGNNATTVDEAMTNLINSAVARDKMGLIQQGLSAGAGVGYFRSNESTHFAAGILDLSNPEGAKAYDALMKGGPPAVKKLIEDGHLAEYQGTTKASGIRVGGRVSAAKLFLREYINERTSGTLSAGGKKVLEPKRELFHLPQSGLLGGKRSVAWLGETYQLPGQEPQTYFQLAFEKRDGATREGEIAKFDRFARAMGATAEEVKAPEGRKGKLSPIKNLFDGKYGDSTQRAVLYFTRPGIMKIVNSSEQDKLVAYGRACQEVQGSERPPAWADPRVSEAALVGLYEQYDKTTDSVLRMRILQAYEKQYGRNLLDDRAELANAKKFVKRLSSLKGKTEAEYIKVFEKLGSEKKFDLWRTMAAMNFLAGTEETLVHELSMKGKRFTWVAKDEGLVPSAASAVGDYLSSYRGPASAKPPAADEPVENAGAEIDADDEEIDDSDTDTENVSAAPEVGTQDRVDDTDEDEGEDEAEDNR